MSGSKNTNNRWPNPQEFWRERRVCVTGGAGFLGSFVVDKLWERGAREIFVPRQAEFFYDNLMMSTQLMHEA